ncbi:hypothetical protein HC358_00820 [Wolbachia pipientis]|uniref:Uncharacterized protein n=1 Tax=Wolbachia pipientis TaxID=955 RepID=A0A7G5C912_WOLPI|nr:hypothetical protein [Wolbachia pipientis]QMV45696.1 hypothetical protein HC358_00820 [Wolbachia pipientis]
MPQKMRVSNSSEIWIQFKNKSEINRSQEMLLKCYLINKFTDIGLHIFEFVS